MITGNRTVLRHLIIVFVLPCVAGVLYAPETAAGFAWNTEFENTTGSVVNDYHIKLVAFGRIIITGTFETGGDVVFNSGVVTGSGTRTVQIDWSGASVNNGETTHVGFWTPGAIPRGLTVAESWWTVGGLKFPGPSGRLAAARPIGGDRADYVIIKVEQYDDAVGTNLIGTEWHQAHGNGGYAMNFSGMAEDPPQTIYARWATRVSDVEEPIENLNEDLTGFGDFTPIMALEPTRFPALSEWGMLVLGLFLLTGVTIAYNRRRRAAA